MTQTVYVLITTEYGTEKEVAEELMQYPEVEDVHILYGQFDVILKIEGETLKAVEEFIFEKIRSNKSIESTETLIAADVSSSEKPKE